MLQLVTLFGKNKVRGKIHRYSNNTGIQPAHQYVSQSNGMLFSSFFGCRRVGRFNVAKKWRPSSPRNASLISLAGT